ncbi:MAG TPA: helix-turn-helix domain-containing protein, partial [Pseudomonadota bacterium]|nr:helix-turn-helix domain-containing protein [Pseudomonadota bacterium]
VVREIFSAPRRGVEDFQKLLSFHESGWDEGTVVQEHPFGIGFTKCLYAATHIVVSSGTRRVEIDTAAALQREGFEVETVAQAIDGTLIELRGVQIADLPPHIALPSKGQGAPERPLARTLDEVERIHILRILDELDQNHTRAAEVLGIDRRTLYRKLDKYRIQHPE